MVKVSVIKFFFYLYILKVFELWRNNNFITGLSIQLMLKIWQFTKSSSNLDILTKQNKEIFLNFFEPIKYQNHFLIFQYDRSSVLNFYDNNLIIDFVI